MFLSGGIETSLNEVQTAGPFEDQLIASQTPDDDRTVSSASFETVPNLNDANDDEQVFIIQRVKSEIGKPTDGAGQSSEVLISADNLSQSAVCASNIALTNAFQPLEFTSTSTNNGADDTVSSPDSSSSSSSSSEDTVQFTCSDTNSLELPKTSLQVEALDAHQEPKSFQNTQDGTPVQFAPNRIRDDESPNHKVLICYFFLLLGTHSINNWFESLTVHLNVDSHEITLAVLAREAHKLDKFPRV